MRMTLLVVSFNRHFFAIALLACAVGVALMGWLDSALARVPLALGVGLALYFMVASVIASYCIYDASDLYKLTWWPSQSLERVPEAGLVVHAGFDPVSAALRARFPDARLRVLDFFDPDKTTEASIQRAHLLNPSATAEERIAMERWPVADGTQDVVFLVNAAHEIRDAGARIAFFREAKRVLKPGGRVIVIEQLRDACNFACFGIAAFHFLSRRAWVDSFAGAGLMMRDEFKITPFVRAFVLVA